MSTSYGHYGSYGNQSWSYENSWTILMSVWKDEQSLKVFVLKEKKKQFVGLRMPFFKILFSGGLCCFILKHIASSGPITCIM